MAIAARTAGLRESARRQLARTAILLRGEGGGLRTRLVRSGSWVVFTQVLFSLLQVARSVALARLLAPEAFGLMAICLVVTRGVETFSETGVRPALIHRQGMFEEARDTAFCIIAARGLVLAVVACGLAPLAAWYYREPRLVNLVCVLALSLAASGFANINTARLEKDLSFRRVAIVEQLGALWSTLIVVGLAYWFRSVWALVIGQVLGATFNVVASYVVVPGRPRFIFSRTLARELLRYGRFISGLTIVLFFTTELDNLVVGKILGMEQLGFYLVAYTLANLPATHISKVLSRLMFPAYAALRDDAPRLAAAYTGVLQVVASVCIAVAAGMIILADEMVRVAYGPKWLPSVGPLRILALFGGVRAVGGINGYLCNGIGKPHIPFYTNLVKLLVIIGVLVPATRAYGLMGAAAAVTVPTAASYLAEIVILDHVGAVSARLTLSVLWRSVAPTLGMCVVLIAARLAVGPVGALGLLVLVAVGGLTFVLLNIPLIGRLYGQYLRKIPTPA